MRNNINDLIEKDENFDISRISLSTLYIQAINLLLYKEIKGDNKVKSFYLNSIILFSSKNYKKLIKLCHKVLCLNKQKKINLSIIEEEHFYGHIVTSYLYTGQYKKCIKYGHRFLSILNNEKNKITFLHDKMAYFQIGLSNLYLKNYHESIKYFDKVIELMKFDKEVENMIIKNFAIPNYNYAYRCKGMAYLKIGDYIKAIDNFNEDIKINGNSGVVYYYKGIAYFYIKKYDKSISEYKKSIKYYSNNFDNKIFVYNALIRTLIKCNKYDDIIKLYRSICKNILNTKITLKYTFNFFTLFTLIFDTIKNISMDQEVINKLINTNFENQKSYLKKSNLYNYTKVNKDSLKNILNSQLWLSNSKTFNDPIDPYIKKNTYNKLNDYILEKIKVACLTTHNDNTLMWSHYADKHQGICVEYDIRKIMNKKNIVIKRINYSNKMNIDNFFINYYKSILQNINIETDNYSINNITDLFIIKSREWKYEDEYRILFYDEENKNPNGTLINLPIKSICFGVQTSKEDKELVYNIVNSINEKNKNKNTKKYKRIKLYQAELDDNEIFKINIKPYEHKKNN